MLQSQVEDVAKFKNLLLTWVLFSFWGPIVLVKKKMIEKEWKEWMESLQIKNLVEHNN